MLSFDLSVVDIALAIAMIILLLLLFSGEKKGQPSTESKKGLMKLSTKLKALFRNTQEKLSAIQLTTNSKKGLMKLSTKLKGILKTTQEKPSTIQPSTKSKSPTPISFRLKALFRNTQEKLSAIQLTTNSKKGLMKLSTKLKALFRNTQEKLSAIQLTTNSKKGLMKLSTKLKGTLKTTQEKPSIIQPSTESKKGLMTISIKLKALFRNTREKLSAIQLSTNSKKGLMTISFRLKRLGLPLFIIFVLSMTASVVYSLTILDKLVHGTLYSYGLRFSYDWAVPYWTILRTIEALVGLSAVVTLTSIIYVYRKHIYAKPQMKTTVTEKVDAPSFATEPQEQSIFGLVKCTHCGNSYSKPFQALELQGDKFRTVNVCPFCSEVIQPVPRQVESKQVKKAVQKQKKNKKPK